MLLGLHSLFILLRKASRSFRILLEDSMRIPDRIKYRANFTQKNILRTLSTGPYACGLSEISTYEENKKKFLGEPEGTIPTNHLGYDRKGAR